MGSMGSYGSIYTSDGDGAIAVDGAGAIGRRRLMGLVPIAPRRRWMPYDAVDGGGAIAVSCKRALRVSQIFFPT